MSYYNDTNSFSSRYELTDPEDQEKSKKETLKNIGIGAAAGVAIGGVAAGLMSMAPDTEEEPVVVPEPEPEPENPEWADDDVNVAHNVTDDMTFNEAFATARAEVGPGGAFEWHGKIYGTYYETEWNAMSAAEKAEFGEHFAWDKVHDDSHTTTRVIHHYDHVAQNQPQEVHVHHHHDIYVNDDTAEVRVLGFEGELIEEPNFTGNDGILIDIDDDMAFELVDEDDFGGIENDYYADNQDGEFFDGGTEDYLADGSDIVDDFTYDA